MCRLYRYRLCVALAAACTLQACKTLDVGQSSSVSIASGVASTVPSGPSGPSLGTDEALTRFKREILQSADIPPDLLRLYETETRRVPNVHEYVDAYEMLGLELIVPGALPSLMTNDYLSEEDLKNPDIRANVKAVDEVFAHCTFVATDDNGNLIGYWRGPEKLPLDQAPVVRFDTEGQFTLLDGLHITEAVAADMTFEDDEKFSELRAAFEKMGVAFSSSHRDTLARHAHPPSESPDEMHQRLYEKYLAVQTAN